MYRLERVCVRKRSRICPGGIIFTIEKFDIKDGNFIIIKYHNVPMQELKQSMENFREIFKRYKECAGIKYEVLLLPVDIDLIKTDSSDGFVYIDDFIEELEAL